MKLQDLELMTNILDREELEVDVPRVWEGPVALLRLKELQNRGMTIPGEGFGATVW